MYSKHGVLLQLHVFIAVWHSMPQVAYRLEGTVMHDIICMYPPSCRRLPRGGRAVHMAKQPCAGALKDATLKTM